MKSGWGALRSLITRKFGMRICLSKRLLLCLQMSVRVSTQASSWEVCGKFAGHRIGLIALYTLLWERPGLDNNNDRFRGFPS